MLPSGRIICALLESKPASYILPPFVRTYLRSMIQFGNLSHYSLCLGLCFQLRASVKEPLQLSHTSKPGHPLLFGCCGSPPVWEHTFNFTCRIPFRHVARQHKCPMSAVASAFGGFRCTEKEKKKARTHEYRQSKEL